jgi:hypothetical protein
MPLPLSPGAGEAALVRDLDHRGPVDRRVILRGGGKARRHHRGQIEGLAGFARDLLRVDQAIAAHPDPVLGLGQFRDHITAALVGDDDLGEARAELRGLGDHPNPGFRTEAAGDDPADRVGAERDCSGRRRRLRWRLLGLCLARQGDG